MFAKRKARKIQVSEDNEEPKQVSSAPEEPMNDGKSPFPKPLRSSPPLLMARTKTADAHILYSSYIKPDVRQIHTATPQELIPTEDCQYPR